MKNKATGLFLNFISKAWNLTLRTKLTILFTFLIGLISVCIFIYVPAKFERQAIKANIGKAQSIAKMTAFSISPALFFEDVETIDNVLTSARQNKDLVYLVVTNDSGRVITAFNKNRANEVNFYQVHTYKNLSISGMIYKTMTPIMKHNKEIGQLYLGLSLKELREEVSRSQKTIALVSVLIFVTGMFAVFGISTMVTRPLNQIVDTVKRITEGDLTQRAIVYSQDEVGILSKAFNDMVENLESIQNELENANRSLEKRAKELQQEIVVRKQAEKALRESEERYRQLVERIPDGIYSSTPNGKFLAVNSALVNMLGYESHEDLLKMDIPRDLYFKPEERNEAFEKFLKENKESNIFRLKKKDGSELWVEDNCQAVLDSQGRSIRYEGVLRDITDRRRAEEEKAKLEAQLRQSQKMQAIGTLAGGIAHDFNNILWVIMGNTEMSLRKLPEDSPIRTKLKEILTASKRAQNLVKQILIFSRKEEQERKPIQIHFIIKEALGLLEATLPSTIKIRHNIDKDCGRVVADPTQIHQMVMNLCTNAYQAMGDNGGLLEISLAVFQVNSQTIQSYPELQEGSYIELTVSDTGCGMDKATMDRIFEPFFTTKGVGEGTGLGLATVHGIVTSLGGTIKVYSEPGKGSTFQVLLPRHDTSGSEQPMRPSNFLDLRGSERILVVDDEKQIVAMVQDMLEELGYHVTTNTSSVEALNQFSAQPDKFDLVITDQTMPEMTGIELARQMLRIRPDIPVILATGFSKMITEENIRNSGIREYLKKPIVFHDLENVVRDVLDDKKIKREEIFL
jgi:PAS domain S-box-containing protein